MAFKVKNAVTMNQRAASLWGKAAMGLEYALRRTGPLTMAPSQLGGFAKSDPSQATANVEYHVQPLSLDKFGDPLHPFPAITASVCNLRPTSRGYVRIKSRRCRARTRRSTRATCRRPRTGRSPPTPCGSPAGSRRSPRSRATSRRSSSPGSSSRRDDELAKAAGDVGTTIFHPVGTCKMSPASDPGAVVDSRLHVHGIERLRVVDASIMPTITSGNTNSPTVMIAERGAEMIRADRRSRLSCRQIMRLPGAPCSRQEKGDRSCGD